MLNPQAVAPGQEQHEYFNLPLTSRRRKRPGKMVQYDYRHTNGTLFSCIAPTLDEARARRDTWLQQQNERV